jgi:PAT family beta-lactamase induction signal transducer AmpG
MGWEAFFIVCTLAALPGLMLLPRFAPWRAPAPAAASGDAQTVPPGVNPEGRAP